MVVIVLFFLASIWSILDAADLNRNTPNPFFFPFTHRLQPTKELPFPSLYTENYK